MRLIDADAYIKEHEEQYKYSDHYETEYFWNAIINAPTIDAEPVVHAKWVGNNGTFCSNCGKSDANAFNHHIPYCWNCGAKMDGDKL